VPEPGDDDRNELQAILALVRDQDSQMVGLAVAHSTSKRFERSAPLRRLEARNGPSPGGTATNNNANAAIRPSVTTPAPGSSGRRAARRLAG
jgi:hypothetical protein